jgi:hypothetical protein
MDKAAEDTAVGMVTAVIGEDTDAVVVTVIVEETVTTSAGIDTVAMEATNIGMGTDAEGEDGMVTGGERDTATATSRGR